MLSANASDHISSQVKELDAANKEIRQKNLDLLAELELETALLEDEYPEEPAKVLPVEENPKISVSKESSRGTNKIECVSHDFNAGDELVVSEQILKVVVVDSPDSFTVNAELESNVPAGEPIKKLIVQPILEKTHNFIRNVEEFDPKKQKSSDTICEEAEVELPAKAFKTERQKQIVRSYTGDALYSQVNAAMYKDDPSMLYEFAGYIRELRDAFRVGQDNAVLQFTSAQAVIRKVKFSEAVRDGHLNMLEKFMKEDRQFCWPSFTSTSTSFSGYNDGNIIFKISLANMRPPEEGQYFPAYVGHVSYYPHEEEVLIPPHCFFRIVNMSKTLDPCIVTLETTEWPSVWKLIKEQDWSRFKAWADKNPEEIDTRSQQNSIIEHVAKSVSKPFSDIDPLDICVDKKANINEEINGETPLTIMAAKASKDAAMIPVVKGLLENGASLEFKTQSGKSAADVMPDIVKVAPLKSFTWQYYMDDDQSDGKAIGWHDMPDSTVVHLNAEYEDFCGGKKGVGKVYAFKSGYFEYDFDFALMEQMNVRHKNRKKRPIRRFVENHDP